MTGHQKRKAERNQLSANALIRIVRKGFEAIAEHRPAGIKISLTDVLMSALAMFSFKDPSLLSFDRRSRQPNHAHNLKAIYHIEKIPSDTAMREILDPVDPEEIRPIFDDIFRELQRGKALEPFQFYDGSYLLSIDGTGYFSSSKIYCPSCLEKHHRNGKVTYSHQMLGASIVHPDLKEVIPVMPEPIIKQDGQTKNDCERNAAKRFLKKFRRSHPHLRVIVIEDGLSSNAPHIHEIESHKMHYILGAKQSDHAFLFASLNESEQAGLVGHHEIVHEKSGIIDRFRFQNNVPLNESHQDLKVNFLEYWEVHPSGRVIHFSWVTDLWLDSNTVFPIMRGGRARWKIENETFNTLKNQGYQFEHNFGHGNENLSVLLATVMMLTFLVDQTLQLCCPVFRGAWHKMHTKRDLWEQMRALLSNFLVCSMQQLLEAICYGFASNELEVLLDTS
jgi:hypothetical protein